MDFNPNCLIVWPEWSSSGIWHPEKEALTGAVSMISHEKLHLPDSLSERFEKWIKWYDDYFPEHPDKFPWEAFKKEGLVLALLLAEFVGDDYQVMYQGKKVIVL